MTTYVLIPGAGGSGWYWHRVVDELSRRAHRGIALDLPADDPAADFAAYTDACLRQIGEAGVPGRASHDIVVVGQSLGGFTAPVLAERLGSRRLILVNAMIPVRGETPGHWFATTGAGQARAELAHMQGRSSGDDLDPMVDFFHDVPEDVVEEALSMGEPVQSDGILACSSEFDAWPADVFVISGSDDRFFPVEFQRGLAADRLGLDVTVIPGGHLVALARPDTLTDALLDASG